MKPVLLFVASLLLIAGCGSSDTSAAVRPSATRTASSIKVGMTMKEVETAMSGPGAADAANPNMHHYPTADGDVQVTFADGKVASVTSSGGR